MRERTIGLLTTAGAVAAASVAATFMKQRHDERRRIAAGEDEAFGSVHAEALPIMSADGLQLHAEVDDGPEPTVVFVHGWMCTLDTWHYQRLALRDRVRMVFADTRSHGRSDVAPSWACSLDDLASDLERILAELAPQGPVVLVGHSMGGMTIMHFARLHPELFGTRVVAVVLVGTSSGQLMRSSPGLRFVGTTLRASSPVIDLGLAPVMQLFMRGFGVGTKASQRAVDEAAEMIGRAPARVIADFFENFVDLDLGEGVKELARVRTAIVSGTKDRMTPFSHSRWLHKQIAGSQIFPITDAGHMVMLEEPEQVTEAIEWALS